MWKGRKRRAADGKPRLFFATDIHGSETCFRKFLNAAAFYRADVLILGGDVTGKFVLPVVVERDGMFSAFSEGNDQLMTSEQKDQLERDLRAQGCYLYTAARSDVEAFAADAEVRETVTAEVIAESFGSWLDLAAERLGDTGVRCFISPGNDDPFSIDPVLAATDYVENPDGRRVEVIGDYEMISLGTTNRTPWDSPRELDEAELGEQLEALVGEVRDPGHAIFNFHCPPWGSDIDSAPELDADLQVKTVLGNPILTAVGSTSVRAVIERCQPLLGLHGHVHESAGMVHLGRTLCINPGSDYGDGVLKGALVTLADDGLDSFQLVSG